MGGRTELPCKCYDCDLEPCAGLAGRFQALYRLVLGARCGPSPGHSSALQARLIVMLQRQQRSVARLHECWCLLASDENLAHNDSPPPVYPRSLVPRAHRAAPARITCPLNLPGALVLAQPSSPRLAALPHDEWATSGSLQEENQGW